MKTSFQEYYNLSTEEFSTLWKSAFFVFDTNTLLNFYRYSESTYKTFVEIIEKIQSKIWIPFQIGKEFHKDRISVINQQVKIYNDSIAKIKDVHNLFINDKNPFLSKESLIELSAMLDKILIELEEKKNIFLGKVLKDDILQNITRLFENKVGVNYNNDELKELYSTANKRYSEKIPPGYQDSAKPEPNKYGDFIIWNQLIDKSKKEKAPIIFISDDRKDDWWLIESGKILGPRPELRKEFFDLTSQLFYIYQPFNFLEYANEYFGKNIDIKRDVIEEVKELMPFSEEFFKLSKNDLLISVTLEKNENHDLQGFVDLLTMTGYEVYHEEVDSTRSKLYIPLPNIPDLKRRVKSKFLSQIKDYGLVLIDFKPSDNI